MEDFREDLIVKEGIFQDILLSDMKFEIFEKFLIKAERKSNKNTIRKGLLMHGTFGFGRGNIFLHFSQSSKFNLPIFKKILQICQNYLNFSEICVLLKHCDEHKHSILHLCAISSSYRVLKGFWRETENFYSNYCSSKYFKDLVKQENLQGFNVLDYIVSNPEVSIHEDFWETLLNTFENREELKDMILKSNNKDNINFIHKLMTNVNPASIETVFKILNQNFPKPHFTEILKLKGEFGMNLLQTAAFSVKVIDYYRLVWKNVRESCNSDAEFLEMLKEVDNNGKNVFHYCSYTSTKEIFEFVIEELEKLATRDEIRNVLLECSLLKLNFPDLNQSVNKVMRKYFDFTEIENFKMNQISLCKLYSIKVTNGLVEKKISDEFTFNFLKSK